MESEIVLKQVASQWIASIRTILPNYQSVGTLYGEIYEVLGSTGMTAGPPLALWYDSGYKESDVDGEAAIFLPEPVQAAGRVTVYELPACAVASVTHAGSFQTLPEAYKALETWMKTSEYSAAGPAREIYLKIGQPARLDDESYITEIQIPVVKKG